MYSVDDLFMASDFLFIFVLVALPISLACFFRDIHTSLSVAGSLGAGLCGYFFALLLQIGNSDYWHQGKNVWYIVFLTPLMVMALLNFFV